MGPRLHLDRLEAFGVGRRVVYVEADTVDRLADPLAESRVATAAAHALTSATLAGLTESVATLRADASAHRWPASAKATVLAASIGAIGGIAALVLGAAPV